MKVGFGLSRRGLDLCKVSLWFDLWGVLVRAVKCFSLLVRPEGFNFLCWTGVLAFFRSILCNL
jgi:hypothetical protein